MEKKNPWQTKSSELIYQNNWIALNVHQVINPAGKDGIYGVVSFKNTAVGVLPVTNDGFIWLVGQFRYALNQYSWEIPEGGCPKGETTLEAAKRELIEETGLVAEKYTLISRLHLSNSVSDEYGELFLAQGLTQHEACPEDTEDISIRKVPVQEAFAMVENGEITDSISIIALQKLELMLLKGQIEFK